MAIRFALFASTAAGAAVFAMSLPALAQGYLPQQPQQEAPPPPPSAVAPNGEYYTPNRQQTQQTYVPQSVALSGPRVLKDWNEGDPIPPGYHPTQRPRGGLIGGGLGLFLPFYIVSAFVAGFECEGTSSDSSCSRHFWPLFIPVAGPLMTIGTAGSSSGGTFTLIVDALAQAGGIVMFGVGIMGHTVLVRNDLGQKLEVTPLLGMGATHTGNGVGLNFTF